LSRFYKSKKSNIRSGISQIDMKPKSILVALGWAVAICSVILQVLYTSSGSGLLWYHYALLFLVSMLGGIAIVDLKDVILGYFIVFPLSFATLIFVMGILPGVTGKLQSGTMALDVIGGMAINLVMRITFPGVWVLCLLGSILGCGIGEKIEGVPETAAN